MSNQKQPPTSDEVRKLQMLITRTIDLALLRSEEYSRLVRFFNTFGLHIEVDAVVMINVINQDKIPVDWEKFITDATDVRDGRDRSKELVSFITFLNAIGTNEVEIDELRGFIKQLEQK